MRQPDYARSGRANGRRFAWPSPIQLANLLLLAAAAGYFLVRGPARALSQGSRDFITVFAATRAWLHGLDPYVAANQFRSATEALKSFPSDQFLVTPFLHMPASLPLFAPFAALPWHLAESTWIVMNVATALWTIQKIARNTKSDGLLLWAFLLAFAPLHTGLTVGQPVVAACALILASIAGSGGVAAGVALGLAGALKPQLAAAFLLVCLARREGRKLTVAVSVLLILGAIGITRMPPGGLGNMLASISSMSGVTGVANGSGLEPLAYQMINVEILAPSLTSTAFGSLMLYTGVVGLSAWAIFRVANTSLCLAVAASASILLRYHRFYDAEILWVAIPAIRALPRYAGRAVWALMAVFLLPGQSMAGYWLTVSPTGLTTSLLFRHEAMAALLIWMVFVGAALIPSAFRRGRQRF